MRENGRRLLLGKTSWQNLRHTMNSYPSNTSNQANNSRANPEGKSQRLGRMASYCIEHAKSGRATCKGCKAKIEQGALRLGTTTPGPGDYDMTSWRHLDCVKKLKGLSGLDAVRGVSSLQPADQAKVQAWYAALSSGVGSGKKRAADAEATAAVVPKKLKAAELKQQLEAHGLSTSGKKADKVKALQQVVDRAGLEAKFGAMTAAELKALLALNGQIKGGDKQELVERCVDCKLFGGLPRCPECGGGVLRVSYTSKKIGHGGQGSFSCPGFFDDEVFKRCKFAASGGVTRIPWKDV